MVIATFFIFISVLSPDSASMVRVGRSKVEACVTRILVDPVALRVLRFLQNERVGLEEIDKDSVRRELEIIFTSHLRWERETDRAAMRIGVSRHLSQAFSRTLESMFREGSGSPQERIHRWFEYFDSRAFFLGDLLDEDVLEALLTSSAKQMCDLVQTIVKTDISLYGELLTWFQNAIAGERHMAERLLSLFVEVVTDGLLMAMSETQTVEQIRFPEWSRLVQSLEQFLVGIEERPSLNEVVRACRLKLKNLVIPMTAERLTGRLGRHEMDVVRQKLRDLNLIFKELWDRLVGIHEDTLRDGAHTLQNIGIKKEQLRTSQFEYEKLLRKRNELAARVEQLNIGPRPESFNAAFFASQEARVQLRLENRGQMAIAGRNRVPINAKTMGFELKRRLSNFPSIMDLSSGQTIRLNISGEWSPNVAIQRVYPWVRGNPLSVGYKGFSRHLVASNSSATQANVTLSQRGLKAESKHRALEDRSSESLALRQSSSNTRQVVAVSSQVASTSLQKTSQKRNTVTKQASQSNQASVANVQSNRKETGDFTSDAQSGFWRSSTDDIDTTAEHESKFEREGNDNSTVQSEGKGWQGKPIPLGGLFNMVSKTAANVTMADSSEQKVDSHYKGKGKEKRTDTAKIQSEVVSKGHARSNERLVRHGSHSSSGIDVRTEELNQELRSIVEEGSDLLQNQSGTSTSTSNSRQLTQVDGTNADSSRQSQLSAVFGNSLSHTQENSFASSRMLSESGELRDSNPWQGPLILSEPPIGVPFPSLAVGSLVAVFIGDDNSVFWAIPNSGAYMRIATGGNIYFVVNDAWTSGNQATKDQKLSIDFEIFGSVLESWSNPVDDLHRYVEEERLLALREADTYLEGNPHPLRDQIRSRLSERFPMIDKLPQLHAFVLGVLDSLYQAREITAHLNEVMHAINHFERRMMAEKNQVDQLRQEHNMALRKPDRALQDENNGAWRLEEFLNDHGDVLSLRLPFAKGMERAPFALSLLGTIRDAVSGDLTQDAVRGVRNALHRLSCLLESDVAKNDVEQSTYVGIRFSREDLNNPDLPAWHQRNNQAFWNFVDGLSPQAKVDISPEYFTEGGSPNLFLPGLEARSREKLSFAIADSFALFVMDEDGSRGGGVLNPIQQLDADVRLGEETFMPVCLSKDLMVWPKFKRAEKLTSLSFPVLRGRYPSLDEVKRVLLTEDRESAQMGQPFFGVYEFSGPGSDHQGISVSVLRAMTRAHTLGMVWKLSHYGL